MLGRSSGGVMAVGLLHRRRGAHDFEDLAAGVANPERKKEKCILLYRRTGSPVQFYMK